MPHVVSLLVAAALCFVSALGVARPPTDACLLVLHYTNLQRLLEPGAVGVDGRPFSRTARRGIRGTLAEVRRAIRERWRGAIPQAPVPTEALDPALAAMSVCDGSYGQDNVLAYTLSRDGHVGAFLTRGPIGGRDGRTRVVTWDFNVHVGVHPLSAGNGKGRTRATDLALTPDKAGVWLAYDDGSIELWSLVDDKLVRELPADDSAISGLALSPRGNWLVAWGSDKKPYLVDAEKAQRVRELEWNTDDRRRTGDEAAATAAFSDDEAWIVAGGQEGLVHVWDRASGTLVHKGRLDGAPLDLASLNSGTQLSRPALNVRKIAFTYDTRRIVAITEAGTFWTASFDPNRKTVGRFYPISLPGIDQALDFSLWGDGRQARVVARKGAHEGFLVDIDFNAGTIVRRFGVANPIVLSGNGNYVLLDAKHNGVRLVPVVPETVDEPETTSEARPARTPGLVARSEFDVTALGDYWPGSLADLAVGQPVSQLVVDSATERVLARFGNRAVVVLHPRTLRPLFIAAAPPAAYGTPSGFTGAAFLPDRRHLVTVEADGSLRKWNLATWKSELVAKGTYDRLTPSPGGRHFALWKSGAFDPIPTQIWDAGALKSVGEIEAMGSADGVMPSEDGSLILSLHHGHLLRLFRSNGEKVWVKSLGNSAATTLRRPVDAAISADGKSVVILLRNGNLEIHPVEGNERRKEISTKVEGNASSVAVTGTGLILVASAIHGGKAGQLVVVDRDSGEILARHRTFEGAAPMVRLQGEGGSLVYGAGASGSIIRSSLPVPQETQP